MSEQTRYLISEQEIPSVWYNIQADLPEPLPPVLHPGTLQPIGPDDLAPLFPMGLIQQEVSTEREIDIPGEVHRSLPPVAPTPLFRARRLEKALDTPARIYYKYEGVSPSGSHKPNTAVAQAYYNKEEGVKRITTETGAGQWGSALAMACNFFGLECKVFMVRVSFEQKPYRQAMMETFGAEVSRRARAARPTRDAPSWPRIRTARGHWVSRSPRRSRWRRRTRNTSYALGSVLNHVLMHQTVVGQEAMEKFKRADDWPDVIVGCTGGGSNFAGIAFPFIGSKLRGERRLPHRSPSSRPPARRSPRARTPTTSATRRT